jgi:signal transduction histidine kinase
MPEALRKHKILLFYLLCVIIIFRAEFYYSLMSLGALVVLHFFYSIFYTELPKVYAIFIILGIVISILNILVPIHTLILMYLFVASIEASRIVIMAILRYPSTIQDLKSLTDELEERVHLRTEELHSANKKLHDANERLQELDEMKTAFVSQASHDLRTPLTAIKGSLDNLSLGIAGELTEKQQRILGRATTSVDRLTNLINDVLDLSRIESGRTTMTKSELSLKALVQNSVQECKPAADQKKIQLNLDEITDSCKIQADGGKIERVIGELINNAIKYTPDNGAVNVSLRKDEDEPESKQVVLCVKDSGIGMSQEDCEKIWDRFYRSTASQHFAKGSGLGLSIAKELVELHDGTLSVESEEGKGTTFELRLPV